MSSSGEGQSEYPLTKRVFWGVYNRVNPTTERHVIWLPDARIGYFRIAKAANSSIRTALAQAFGLTSQEGHTPGKDAFWSEQERRRVKRMRTSTFAMHPGAKGGWSFSFVRHPVSRLYSCWENKVIQNPELLPDMARMGIVKNMDFDDFVKVVARTDDAKCEIHLRSQASILTWRRRVVPDFVGRVETAEADWARVQREIKARCGIELGPMLRRNVRGETGPEVIETLKPETRALIAERYAGDFRLFYPEAAPRD